MQGLYFDGTGASILTLPLPRRGSGEALIRVEIAAVCNTDKEILRGYRPSFHGVMGHEFCGIVEDSDNPELVGKRIVGELNEGCGECFYCKSEREKHCVSRRVIGIEGRDGCFAPYLTLADRLVHIVPDGLAPERAIFAEPLAAAVQICEMVHIRPSESICVVGDGRLAYMIAQVLALTGADVAIKGLSPEKLRCFAPFARIGIADGETFETVIDATGSPSGILTAKSLVRHGGTVVLKTTYAGDSTPINLSAFVVDEVRIVGSRCGPFEPALRLLSRGLIDLPQIEIFALDDWQSAFDSNAFKAGFKF